MGLEPTTTGITIQDSTVELRPPSKDNYLNLPRSVIVHAILACPAGLEPTTPSLEGWCSIRLSYGQPACKAGRGGEIRTPDILLPKQARYQAAPHPEKRSHMILRESQRSNATP